MKKKGLGKGLGALIPSAAEEDELYIEEVNDEVEVLNTGVIELKLNEIEPNNNQPRKKFDDDKLLQLSESIKQHGVVQPIIVQKDKDIYRIVAGERRWRAARLAGVSKIPAIIREYTNKELMEVALIENIQREDLNPIEEAEAFDKLIKEFKITQEELSNIVGRSRSAIANSIRLLGLSESIKTYLINGDISSGHARALLSIVNKELQDKIVKEIIERDLSVRDTEKIIKDISIIPKEKKEKKEIDNLDVYMDVEKKLQSIFGTKVKLIPNNKNKGKILIEYYSPEELDRIIDMVDSFGES